MSKKTLTAVLCGILAAALVLIIVGLIVYFTSAGIKLDSSAADYAALSQQKSAKMAIGMLIIIVGCSGFIMPAVALIIIMVINAVSAAKKSKK